MTVARVWSGRSSRVLAKQALIILLYVLFCWAILAGVVARLAVEFALVGWETVERVL